MRAAGPGSPSSSAAPRAATTTAWPASCWPITWPSRPAGCRPSAPRPLVLPYPEDPSSRHAYSALCDRIIAEGVDGVVCYHDRVAIGLAFELLTRGRRVPQDVALTGFDDQSIGREFSLGITTYAYPARQVAAEAIATMRRRAKDPAAPPIRVVVPSRLIVRESSAVIHANGRV